MRKIHSDFHGGPSRLRNCQLLLNCRKKNQLDWIWFQTSRESSKISLSFQLFLYEILNFWSKLALNFFHVCVQCSNEKWLIQSQLRPKIQLNNKAHTTLFSIDSWFGAWTNYLIVFNHSAVQTNLFSQRLRQLINY
jgi:hypothetical protein